MSYESDIAQFYADDLATRGGNASAFVSSVSGMSTAEIYTAYQKAYSEVIGEVHTAVPTQPSPVVVSSPTPSTVIQPTVATVSNDASASEIQRLLDFYAKDLASRGMGTASKDLQQQASVVSNPAQVYDQYLKAYNSTPTTTTSDPLRMASESSFIMPSWGWPVIGIVIALTVLTVILKRR